MDPAASAPEPARRAGLVAGDDEGAPATDPEYLATPELVVDLLGTALGHLHACPTVGAGVPELRPPDLVERARRRLAEGRIAPDSLPVSYRHMAPERLVDVLAQGAERAATGWAPVLSHGSPTVAHLRCRDGRALGFSHWEGAALADRHLDLAAAAADVAATLVPALLPQLVDRYLATSPDMPPPDPLLLDWYALAAVLVPVGPPP